MWPAAGQASTAHHHDPHEHKADDDGQNDVRSRAVLADQRHPGDYEGDDEDNGADADGPPVARTQGAEEIEHRQSL